MGTPKRGPAAQQVKVKIYGEGMHARRHCVRRRGALLGDGEGGCGSKLLRRLIGSVGGHRCEQVEAEEHDRDSAREEAGALGVECRELLEVDAAGDLSTAGSHASSATNPEPRVKRHASRATRQAPRVKSHASSATRPELGARVRPDGATAHPLRSSRGSSPDRSM